LEYNATLIFCGYFALKFFPPSLHCLIIDFFQKKIRFNFFQMTESGMQGLVFASKEFLCLSVCIVIQKTDLFALLLAVNFGTFLFPGAQNLWMIAKLSLKIQIAVEFVLLESESLFSELGYMTLFLVLLELFCIYRFESREIDAKRFFIVLLLSCFLFGGRNMHEIMLKNSLKEKFEQACHSLESEKNYQTCVEMKSLFKNERDLLISILFDQARYHFKRNDIYEGTNYLIKLRNSIANISEPTVQYAMHFRLLQFAK
jgi:hypothetical protein